ncbi:E3 ubiquitin-protein ligase WAV3-like [Triticum dicoccoides]|uniref:E3 ubiquitin-protein ligase WAV3-like n=1 Tax=Triticum dicoccoides TaxID=85692 RepID=UPI00188E84E5|nr:E3 ubiquitin-protein ligase WAV3-like [Triticum dicoccoides]
MASAGQRCAGCYGGIGRLEAAFSSECAHTFHPLCVSGAHSCPSCSAFWSFTPTFQLSPLHPQPARMPTVHHGAAASRFHLACVTGSVCPVCNARWPYQVSSYPYLHPYQFPPPPPLPRPMPMWASAFVDQPSAAYPPHGAAVYDDDEPLEPLAAQGAPLDDWDLVQDAANGGGRLVLDAHCEHPAVARGEPHDNFVVLVHAKAPGAATAAAAEQTRTPLDLVTVLDVSGSMTGDKIALLKKAMEFVVDQLGPADRLSVVAFSTDARRLIPLTRMSDAGKVKAKGAVQLLIAGGGTNILKGLTEAAKVLDGRRHKNAVASVILLSDGQDTYNLGGGGYNLGGGGYSYGSVSCSKNYRALVPGSLLSGAGHRSTPIHTFGFGGDHDSSAMHTIAEETGDTFSFIEDETVVQDSFAQCIGGLLSVVVQDALITVKCVHPVRVRAVKSGRYDSSIDAYARSASVDVGELYADEERRFLLLVDVPKAGEADEVTQIMKVTCTYRDTATWQVVDVAGEDVAVQRPVEVAKDQQPSMEVAREKFRVEATEDIAAARAAAERGEYAEAARILDRRQEALLPALADDARCKALVEELRELSTRVASRREYEKSGRACILTGYSSHAQQRAASACVAGAVGGYRCPPPPGGAGGMGGAASVFGFGAAGAYATPAMQMMVGASRRVREQQQQPSTLKRKSGSDGGN